MTFFIIGVGRSGTSLLQSILSSHSNICLPPETGFVRQNILAWHKQEECTTADLKSINGKLSRVIPEIEHKLPTRHSDELYFFKTVLKLYRNKKSKDKMGDKDPRLIEFIDAVSKLFPDAKFIHLIRDPRDVLLSKRNAEWSKDKPGWYHIFANYIQLKIGEWQGKKLPKGKYLLLTYEELLNNPEISIKKACSFLGVEFEESMLSFQDKAKELVSEDEKQWKQETMGPLLKNNTGKWKGKLTEFEVALTEMLSRQAFEIGSYQYSKVYDSLPFFQKLKVSLISLSLKGVGLSYMAYRLLSQKLLVAWKY